MVKSAACTNGYHGTCFRVFAFRLARAKLVQIEQSAFSVKPPVAVNTISACKRGDALRKATHPIIYNPYLSRTSPPTTHYSPYIMDTCQKCPFAAPHPSPAFPYPCRHRDWRCTSCRDSQASCSHNYRRPGPASCLVVRNVGILWWPR
jgi:hypothetical protein